MRTTQRRKIISMKMKIEVMLGGCGKSTLQTYCDFVDCAKGLSRFLKEVEKGAVL